jgi:hypothetical protein
MELKLARSSDMSKNIYHTTRCHISEDSVLHSDRNDINSRTANFGFISLTFLSQSGYAGQNIAVMSVSIRVLL